MGDLFNISKKVVVITGGTGILGSVIATYLAGEGASVVILGRRKDVGEALVREINEKGGEALFLETDVMDADRLTQNRKEILLRFGRIDVLLNAAGGNMAGANIPPEKTFFDLDMEQFDQVVRLNLTGSVLPSQIFLQAMVERKRGVIINFSSMAAFRPMTRVVGYAAAKAAVTNFTQYLATEVATKFGEGIRVNAIAPGFFLTEQNRELLTNPDGSYTQRGLDVIRQTPFKRLGKPEELCGTIHYLVSDASAFVTGTTITVDGGFNVFAM